MSLENVALYLEASGLGTQGQSIFVGSLPISVTGGILLRQSGGNVDRELDGIRQLMFQAVIRGSTYPAGMGLAESFMNAFPVRQKSIGTAFFYQIYTRHEPIPFGRETTGVETFVVNLDAVWRKL